MPNAEEIVFLLGICLAEDVTLDSWDIGEFPPAGQDGVGGGSYPKHA